MDKRLDTSDPTVVSVNASYQEFVCESVPIVPGTKAGPRRIPSAPLAPWIWWLVTATAVAAALLTGWLLGRGG